MAAKVAPPGPEDLARLLGLEQSGQATSQVLCDIGRHYMRLREWLRAAAYFEKALAAGPISTLNFVDYGSALMEGGQLDKAAAAVAARVAANPKDYTLVNLLGVIYRRQRRYEDALAQFREARKLDAKALGTWINSGNVYMDMFDGAKAEDMYLKAARMDPKQAEYVRLAGRAQQVQGQFQKAIATLRRALLMNPRQTKTIADLTLALMQGDRPAEALDFISKKLEQFAGDATLLQSKADVLVKLGKLPEAIPFFEQALQIQPKDTDIWIRLGRALLRSDREKANACFRRALEIDPQSQRGKLELCGSLVRSRYGSEAEHIAGAYQLACELADGYRENRAPVADDVKATLIRCMDYDRVDALGTKHDMWDYWLRRGDAGAFHQELGRVTSYQERLDLVDYHRRWGEKVEAKRRPEVIKRAPRGPRSKLRIGFYSSDLRNHPVGYFALPLFQNYDRERFEVFGYSCFAREADDVQKYMTSIVNQFRWWPGAGELAIAQGMADDNLDILIEMGATTMDKFEAMAYRPAPVQVSWLGYPHSTGLTAIDYIVVDPYIKPDDPRLLIEKPLEVPETWVTLSKLGFVENEILADIPEKRRGYITFGTMNNPYKYTREGIATWAAIMHRVPGSRFLFVRPEGAVDAFRANAEKIFASHGIAPDRLMFPAVRGLHLPHYNDIDIALDPFPHVGGTTTCESIWMGVPVITLVGPAFFERLSYSNLSNAGLGDLCTFSVSDYIEKAVALAADRPRREHLRHGLRPQIRNAPLGQPERFSRTFFDAIAGVAS